MNKHELRKQIEDQVALEKRAHKHVEDMVLKDAVGKDYFQTVVRMHSSFLLKKYESSEHF